MRRRGQSELLNSLINGSCFAFLNETDGGFVICYECVMNIVNLVIFSRTIVVLLASSDFVLNLVGEG